MRRVPVVVAVVTCTITWYHQSCSAFSSPFLATEASPKLSRGGVRRRSSSFPLFTPSPAVATHDAGRATETRRRADPRDDRSLLNQSSSSLDCGEETTTQEEPAVGMGGQEKTREILLSTTPFQEPKQEQQGIVSATTMILYAASLIVANTVGSAMLGFPDVVSDSGFLIPSIIFFGVFALNLLTSGFIIEYIIDLYEAGIPASEVPVSFKDIADESYGPAVGNFVTALSVLFNYCIIIFNVIRFGEAVETLLPNSTLDASTLSLGFAAVLTSLVGTSSNVSLSKVTSFSVVVLFCSFAGLVLPGLSNTSWDTFFTNSGGFLLTTTDGSPDILSSLIISGPFIVYCMEIQKIVPSVTKLCNFDRGLSRVAVTVGQLIPMLMYMSWIYGVLGGGVTGVMDGGGDNGILLPAFTFSSILGCTIAGSMSLSEEFTSFLSIIQERFFPEKALMDNNYNNMKGTLLVPQQKHIAKRSDHDFGTTSIDDPPLSSFSPSDNIDVAEEGPVFYSLPAVLLAIIPPLLIGLKLSSDDDGEGVLAALDFSGGYLIPLFIWIFPAMLAWKQLNESDDSVGGGTENKLALVSIVGAVACGVAVIGLELTKDLGSFLSSFDA